MSFIDSKSEDLMTHNRLSSSELLHFRANVNGRPDLIQMEVSPDGKLSYPGLKSSDFRFSTAADEQMIMEKPSV
jgi:hypothetical protein